MILSSVDLNIYIKLYPFLFLYKFWSLIYKDFYLTLVMHYTVITGASQGMGLEMAKECARLGRNILLISLPNEKLSEISKNISEEFKVRTDFFEIDLTEIKSANKIYEWVIKNKYDVKEADENQGKQPAAAEETAPVVAETPVDTDLQSENGSLESPRKSVRKQTREKELSLIAEDKQELINMN